MFGRNLPFVLLFVLAGCAHQDESVKSVSDYRAEATAAVVGMTALDAKAFVGDDAVVFVDVREGYELEREGRIEGAVHVPRGILEFVIDSESSRHMEVFSSDKRIVFYCASGGRSVLATKLAKDMGVANPVNLEGGFRGWKAAGGAITIGNN